MNVKNTLKSLLSFPTDFYFNNKPLVIVSESNGIYSLKKPHIPMFVGWYMFELQIDNKLKKHQNLVLINNEERGCIPLKGSKLVKRLFFFKTPSDHVLIESSEDIRDITIYAKRVSKKFVSQRVASKLKSANYNLLSTVEENYPQYNELFKNTQYFTYDDWIAKGEKWNALIENQGVKFSIIVPTYNTDIKFFNELYDSVKLQTYQNWELIIVDDASTCADLLSYLKSFELNDKVQVIFNKSNLHISHASNIGVSAAHGDYIIFLDHDDKLSPFALNELACALAGSPDLKLIYSDEDLMSEDGQRLVPHFKSDWNPDLLTSHNFITHLTCYEKRFFNFLNGFRIGYEGAQDYDLVLRASKYLTIDDVAHIPKVLYHWRMIEGSTALNANAKQYATEAGLLALNDYLSEYGASAAHDVNAQNFYQIKWPMPKSLPLVSIIIPTRDAVELLSSCIDSLIKTVAYKNLELIIIDNGSVQEKTMDYFRWLQGDNLLIDVKIFRDAGDFNFSRLINFGASMASGEALLLLNNDIEALEPSWFEEMLSHCIREDIGCVGAKLLYPDMTIQHAGIILGLGGYAAHSHRESCQYDNGYFRRPQIVQNLSAVTAACLMVKRSIFFEVNGFDESFAVAYNDVDFCLKVKNLGKRNLYTPFAQLIHHESKTRGYEDTPEKQHRFNQEKELLLDRWYATLINDPYYNPNLTRSNERFSLRFEMLK